MLRALSRRGAGITRIYTLSRPATTVAETVEEVRRWRSEAGSCTVGFVPTMGALHEGHLSLVRRAREECDVVAASVFVNPKQFAEGEDYGTYPRPRDEDLGRLMQEGVSLIFAPTAPTELYPPQYCTYVDLKGVDDVSEGTARPGFFRGVATVVAKLFNIVQPTRAYFGQKDGLQSIVIKRMARDLNFPVDVEACPTVREPDGLAMSSRNVYLTAEQRAAAPDLHAALLAAQEWASRGASAIEARAAAERVLSSQPQFTVQYISCADLDSGAELADGARASHVMISAAVKIGDTRLIDNVVWE